MSINIIPEFSPGQKVRCSTAPEERRCGCGLAQGRETTEALGSDYIEGTIKERIDNTRIVTCDCGREEPIGPGYYWVQVENREFFFPYTQIEPI